LENAPELLRLFVQALALFATSLDRWFQIPWPLVLAVVFVPMVAALDVGVCYIGSSQMSMGEWRPRKLER